MIISQMSRMLTLDEKRVASSATSSGPAGVCNVDEDWVIMYLGDEKRWDEMDYPYCRHSRTGSCPPRVRGTTVALTGRRVMYKGQ
jgi:hypothetical protein